MRPVVVAAEHPSLVGGFTTQAIQVGRQLHRRGWPVRYLGFEEPAPEAPDLPFPVESTGTVAGLAGRLADLAPERPLFVFFGRAHDVLAIDEGLRRRGERRRVDVTFYAAVDHTPAPDAVRHLAATVDRVVPATAFAAAAIGTPGAAPVPHGVDPDVFHPRTPVERKAARADLGVGDELLVGYVGRNSHHKRPDLALRTFAHLATGAWARCPACGWATVAEVGVDGRFEPVARCRRCSSDAVVAADPHPDARLLMHTDLASRRERHVSGGFDLAVLARRFGVADRVVFDRSLVAGGGVPVGELAARMAALDVHVLLGNGGGWELTVLETGACGVPNLVTDHAGPATFARPFSRMVPVALQLVQPYGIEAVADLDVAVAILAELATDPEARAALGAAGPPTAARYAWDRVGDAWHALLTEVAT